MTGRRFRFGISRGLPRHLSERPGYSASALYSELHTERVRDHVLNDTGAVGSRERRPLDDPGWLTDLAIALGETARVVANHRRRRIDKETANVHLREELVRIGAIVAAWIDALDGKGPLR